MRSAMCVAAVVLVGSLAAGDDGAAVKEIPTKGLKIARPERGQPTAPTVVASADELAKSAALKGAADEIGKQVDFGKQKLVFFAWAGSGQDRVTPDAKTPGAFTYAAGRTRDLRPHVKLFVVPKDAGVKVVSAR